MDTDLIWATMQDRDGLTRQVQRAENPFTLVADVMHQIRDDVAAQTGPFAEVGGLGTQHGTVEVSMACVGREGDLCAAQRRAGRHNALTFRDPGRIRRGQRAAALHEAPDRWRAVTDASYGFTGPERR